jgi:hypothetical protein
MSVLLVVLMLVPQDWSTCGGGGGGGMGGIGGAGMGGVPSPSAETYPVPWKLIQPGDPLPNQALAVYWLPSSQNELLKSSLRFSRVLQVYAQQCVAMGVVDYTSPLGSKLIGDQKPPVAVLAQPDGR